MIRISIHSNPIPDGYKMFKATRWPLNELGLSYEKFGFATFMIIPLYTNETKTWSAVKGNFSFMSEVTNIWTLQPPDVELSKKMNWLCGNPTGMPGTPMWTADGKDWDTSALYTLGTQLWGDQHFLASEETFWMDTPSLGYLKYRKVLPFRKEMWSLDPDEHRHFFPQACIASKDGIKFEWDYRGRIYTPLMVLDPRDYKFAGSKKPEAFYIPDKWCLTI